MQTAFFACIVAAGTIIATNLTEFATIPVFMPPVKATEIVVIFGSACALDYVSSGYNFSQ